MEDLLDSALDDFDNLPKPAKVTKKKTARKQEARMADSGPPSEEDFLKIFQTVGGQGDATALQAELESLSRLAQGGQPGEHGDTAASLKETLEQMSKETAGLGAQPSEEELQALFSNLGMPGSQGGQGPGLDNLMPMMEGMMQSLLSKDLLYPAMKELAEKFPDYLADNRSSLSEDKYKAYNKQCDLTRKICFKFEEEDKDKDTEVVKKARFQEVMAMMQEMQSLGHPPKELTGDNPASFPLDGQGMPTIPGMPQDCAIS